MTRTAGGSDWIAIQALLAALSARGLHDSARTVEVGILATRVARGLGLGDDDVRDVEELVALHDVGLIAMADGILHKRGPLDDAERERLYEHPRIAAVIVRSLDSLAHLAPLVEAEHERWDGHGYPANLAGEEIPLASRIVLACDAYAAMLRERPDRPALGRTVAIQVLRRNAGSQFCPRVVDVLLDVLEGSAALPTPAPPTVVLPNREPPPHPLSPQPRLGRRLYLMAAFVGTALGLLWALPVGSVADRCPPAGESEVWCTIQKAWLPALIEVEAVMLAALLLTWLIAVALPRLARGGYRQPKRPWPDGTDPVLAAASWTVRRPPTASRRVPRSNSPRSRFGRVR